MFGATATPSMITVRVLVSGVARPESKILKLQLLRVAVTPLTTGLVEGTVMMVRLSTPCSYRGRGGKNKETPVDETLNRPDGSRFIQSGCQQRLVKRSAACRIPYGSVGPVCNEVASPHAPLRVVTATVVTTVPSTLTTRPGMPVAVLSAAQASKQMANPLPVPCSV